MTQADHTSLKAQQMVIMSLLVCLPLFTFLGYRVGKTQGQKEVVKLQLASPVVQPNTSPAPQANTQQFVAKVAYRGGFCMANTPCESVTMITPTGEVMKDDAFQKQLTDQQLATLKEAISTTDYLAIRNKPFTGTCPVAFDGQELIYTFSLDQHEEVLASCTYDLENVTLIQSVQALITE